MCRVGNYKNRGGGVENGKNCDCLSRLVSKGGGNIFLKKGGVGGGWVLLGRDFTILQA